MKSFLVSPELQRKYIERRLDEIDELEGILCTDLEATESFGHKLKGNGASYGFELLGELGAKLEIAAKEKDLEQVQALFLKVKEFIHEQN